MTQLALTCTPTEQKGLDDCIQVPNLKFVGIALIAFCVLPVCKVKLVTLWQGVEVQHRGVVNMVVACRKLFCATPADVFVQQLSTSFDASITDIFIPLAAGASIVPAAPGAHRDAPRLLRQICNNRVTIAALVPSELEMWHAAGNANFPFQQLHLASSLTRFVPCQVAG